MYHASKAATRPWYSEAASGKDPLAALYHAPTVATRPGNRAAGITNRFRDTTGAGWIGMVVSRVK